MTMNKLDALLTSLGLATISESMAWAEPLLSEPFARPVARVALEMDIVEYDTDHQAKHFGFHSDRTSTMQCPHQIAVGLQGRNPAAGTLLRKKCQCRTIVDIQVGATYKRQAFFLGDTNRAKVVGFDTSACLIKQAA